ncbi:uncharacterized protein LOC116201821 [Punica granatum]|uniref:Uncharacterized protein LOC116201821 n=2 Tax=Punica granatum TaxID=22663 RepID=A0A6P8D3S0_PUNGR|nr:uncharacterized protein LOC116201821 [Punica granatum]PKI63663.1 hypothetical protein CRG98_015951 [Punica granatum]
MMNFAISRAAARNYYPYQTLLAPPTAGRRPGGAVKLRRLTVVSSSCKTEDTSGGNDMDKVDDQAPKVKDKDAMEHSFGEGYATRSDEEGFGGIYGGNQPGEIKHANEIHEDHPLYDRTQGSEVKEKEKARHQTGA